MNGNWRKSTHSIDTGCVEAATWRKSTHSMSGVSPQCVEAGTGQGIIGVRDTTLHGKGPVLAFSPAAWSKFTGGLK